MKIKLFFTFVSVFIFQSVIYSQWTNPKVNITCNTRGAFLRTFVDPRLKITAFSVNPAFTYYSFHALDLGAHIRYNIAWSSGLGDPARFNYNYFEGGVLFRKIINYDLSRFVFFSPDIYIKNVRFYPLCEAKFFFGDRLLFPNGSISKMNHLVLSEVQNKAGVLITSGKSWGMDVGLMHFYNPAIKRNFLQFYVNFLYSFIQKPQHAK